MAFYNCLLIDSDGTLLDFDTAEETAFYNTMQHFDLPYTQDTFLLYREINNALWASLEDGKIRQDKLLIERFRVLLDKLGEKGNAIDINKFYLDNLSLGGSTIQGADELLCELAEVATIAVVTNGIEKVQNARFKASGLDKYVDAVYVSERVGAAKPQRKMFDVALAELGVDNRKKVLVIGDSLRADVRGGINAGLDTCWCNFGNIENDTGIKPTHTVRGYEELMRVIMEEEELENVGSSEKRHRV
ncbi:MAG: YjjG family noncanonical pyrimidine nucleotidase [Oscillospiraceae bacterium]